MKNAEFRNPARRVRKFVKDRDWEQFHSPKNLSMALSVECAELMEHFQWLTESQSRKLSAAKRREVEAELADVQIYLLRLSQMLDVDLLKACGNKLVENGRKYPVAKAKGKATKYSELK